jgi:hypothetical protein
MHFGEIPGGLLVYCRLCGRRATKRTFMATNTDYADARREATAYHWQHEHSAPHEAALAAFHAEDVPDLSPQDRLMAEIFDKPLPDERQRRRNAAYLAARKARATR